VERNLRFDGTYDQFGASINALVMTSGNQHGGLIMQVGYPRFVVPVDPHHVLVRVSTLQDVSGHIIAGQDIGKILAYPSPQGAILSLRAEDEFWPAVLGWWDAIASWLTQRGWHLESLDAALPVNQVTPEPEPRGAKAGTFERVKEAHRLITKEYRTRRAAFKRARTDSRTYDRWCKEATGDEPAYSE